MYLYNITYRVENKIFDSWKVWVLEKNIPTIMSLGLFSSFRFCCLLGEENVDAQTYALQFKCESWETFLKYRDGQMAEFFEQQISLFGEEVLTFSSLLEIQLEG
jgi:hypothetical protein